jgi:DNA topoisomerase-1
MPGLTAKVFRTWKCTDVLKKELNNCAVTKGIPEHEKLRCAKMANLEVAKVANHKRKVPANFDQRLVMKEEKVKQLEAGLEEKKKEGKKTDALSKRVAKAKVDLELTRETREYNLGTSLKSYIDPRAYAKWAKQVDFPLEKIYSKTLRKKFSWALGKLD